uniref:Putative secreted peptide n=1 Tax=Anopheles braziliensis TaxID=58242 RepID=A0A2M3ZVZ1_9DIPT
MMTMSIWSFDTVHGALPCALGYYGTIDGPKLGYVCQMFSIHEWPLVVVQDKKEVNHHRSLHERQLLQT